jgi:hypothetical protein
VTGCFTSEKNASLLFPFQLTSSLSLPGFMARGADTVCEILLEQSKKQVRFLRSDETVF